MNKIVKSKWIVIIGFIASLITIYTFIKKEQPTPDVENKTIGDYYHDNYGTFMDDRDGNIYKWVKLGDQIWMAENLAYLPEVVPYGKVGKRNTHHVRDYKGYSVKNAKSTKRYKSEGVRYDLFAAGEAGCCIPGWRLPFERDWQKLEKYLGMPNEQINMFTKDYDLASKRNTKKSKINFVDNGPYWSDYRKDNKRIIRSFWDEGISRNLIDDTYFEIGMKGYFVRLVRDL